MKEFAKRLTHRSRIFGELTVKDVKAEAAKAGLVISTRVSLVPRGARCDRCRRRLTAKVFTIVMDAGDFHYGPKCYKIVKEAQ